MIVREKIDFSRISDCANYLSKAAHVAYWTDGDNVRLAHHEGSIIAEFQRIADILGYRVEKIEQPVEAPAGEVGDLNDQRASLIARGIDPNLDHLPVEASEAAE